MLIPLRHENMEGRRWPMISLALIVINFVAFFATHWRMDEQNPQRGEIRAHILILAALHPELNQSPEVREFVAAFQRDQPVLWSRAASPYREVEDAWEAKIRMTEDPAKLQEEMDSLAQKYAQIQSESLLEHYGFVPAHPQAISYITANFLHAGWLHIIGNMWFLWLAGAILEDTWGRLIYPIFYFLAGAAALQFHAWTVPGSVVPTLGASGAVAALMGAFLVRFPKTRIQMLWIFGFGVRSVRFWARAYWLLPLWLLLEIFSGSIVGRSSGVAHWAHVGGFAFGAIAALVLRHSGLEHKANQAIEAKVSWSVDSAVLQATEKMHEGKLDEGVALLLGYLGKNPNSLEGYTLLSQLYWRKNDVPKYHEAVVKALQLHLKAHETEAAWHNYDEFLNTGGERLPASTWLELCRAAEGQQHFDRAVGEYDKLARAYPNERQSLLALMSAGRLSLKQLNRPAEALGYYKAASTSLVPHLDWQVTIDKGIQEAEKALLGAPVPAA